MHDLLRGCVAGEFGPIALQPVEVLLFHGDGEGLIEGEEGIEGAGQQVVPGSESIDDISVSNRFLFALDAREPGHLSVFSLSDSIVPCQTCLDSLGVEIKVWFCEVEGHPRRSTRHEGTEKRLT